MNLESIAVDTMINPELATEPLNRMERIAASLKIYQDAKTELASVIDAIGYVESEIDKFKKINGVDLVELTAMVASSTCVLTRLTEKRKSLADLMICMDREICEQYAIVDKAYNALRRSES
ncbi:MAG TPA: hypothetical protein VF077_06165 [Nitrospiraceae bacterium]